MLGTGQEILGSVAENARTIQAEKEAADKKAQGMANNAMEPGQRQADARAEAAGTREGNSVTITPQLAEGLSKATGDESWKRATGTKMDARIYSSLLTMGVKKKLSNRIVQTDSGTFEFNEEDGSFNKIGPGKTKEMTGFIGGKKMRGTISYDDDGNPTFKPLDEGITPAAEHPTKPKAASGGGKEETPEQKKEKALKILNDISKAKDQQAKKALVEGYNKIAPDVGLDPYEDSDADKLKAKITAELKSGAATAGSAIKAGAGKVLSSLNQPGAGAPAAAPGAAPAPQGNPKRDQAVKWLQDNGLPVTEPNIKHYLDNS